PSATGKETFIRKVVDPKSAGIRSSLGGDDKKVVACWESIEWVGRKRDKSDLLVAKRTQLVPVVQKLATQADVILIKGQDVDLLADRPNQMLNSRPGYRHKIIYIATAVGELMQRLPNKPWWDGTDTPAVTTGWVNYQLDLLQS